MPVTRRGNKYQATVHHQGKRYRKSFDTLLDAETWELQTKAALMRGESIPERDGLEGGAKGPATLAELMEMTRRLYWAGKGGEKAAVRNANKVLDILGHNTAPSAVTTATVDSLIMELEAQGLSNGTINRRLSALSKMMTHAYQREYITRKPVFSRRKESEGRIRYITPAEEEKMLDYFNFIGQQIMADLYIVGVDTGVRIGELLRIEARDVHQAHLSVWKQKGDKPRSIPLTKRAAEVISRLSKANPTGPIFKDIDYATARRFWKHAQRHLKLSDDRQFTIHVMRHTFCSRLVQRGVNIVAVSKLAGHSSIRVTMRYAHLAPENLRSAIDALEPVNVTSETEDMNLVAAPPA